MGKYIELISQLKPINGKNFPIVDSQDVIGGYVQFDTYENMVEHPDSKLRIGMLAYVISRNKIYQLINR